MKKEIAYDVQKIKYTASDMWTSLGSTRVNPIGAPPPLELSGYFSGVPPPRIEWLLQWCALKAPVLTGL